MGSKACIYENASILGKVDAAALRNLSESLEKQGFTPEQADISAWAQMTQEAVADRAELLTELNREHELKLPTRTVSYLKDANKLVDSQSPSSSFAKDLLANAMTPRFIRKKLSDFFSVKKSDKNKNILSVASNFFSRYLTGYRADALPEMNLIQEAGLKEIATVAEFVHTVIQDQNSFLANPDKIYANNLDGGIVTGKDGNKYDSNGNPVGYLVQQTEDGELYISENLSGAMTVILMNWVHTYGEDSLVNDSDAMKSILGIPSSGILQKDAEAVLSNVGDVRSAMAERIGKEIYNLTGLKVNKDTKDGDMEAKMQLALGLTAIAAGERAGILEQNTLYSSQMADLLKPKNQRADSYSGEVTNFIRVATTGTQAEPNTELTPEAENTKRIIKHSAKVLDLVFGVVTTNKEVSLEPITEVNTKVKNTLQEVSEQQESALRKAQSVEQVIFQDNIEIFNFLGAEALADHLGFEHDIKGLHVTARLAARGKNTAIVREIQNVREFTGSLPTPETSFYHRWEVWKNLRMGLTTSLFNPQASKIHRFLGGAKSWVTKIDPADKVKMDYFYTALAQSIDIKIDKLTLPAIKKELIAKLDSPVYSAAIEAIQTIQSGKDLSIDTIEDYKADIFAAMEDGGEGIHTMAGLIAAAAEATAEGGPFTTSLVLETDGITNGVIIGLVQSMLETDSAELAQAGGLHQDRNIDTNGEWKKNDANLDLYERVAVLWGQTLNGLASPEYLKTLNSLVGDLVDTDEEGNSTLSRFARNLAKTPLMTSNYGAAIESIVEQLGTEAIENFYLKLMEAKDQAEVNALVSSLDVFNDNLEDKYNFRPVKAPLFAARKDWELNGFVEAMIKRSIAGSSGIALEHSLASTFSGFTEYRNAVNKNFNAMFAGFKVLYDAAIKEMQIKNGYAVTEAQKVEVYNSLQKYLPSVRTPYSKGHKQKLVIMKTVRTRDTNNTAHAVQIRMPKPLTNTTTIDGKPIRSMKGTITKIEFDEGGVSGGVLTTQMLDAHMMIDMMENFDTLNVHDAQLGGLDEIVDATIAYNESFLKHNVNFSVLEETNKALARIIKELGKGNTPEALIAVNKALYDPDQEVTTDQVFPTLAAMNEDGAVKKNNPTLAKAINLVEDESGGEYSDFITLHLARSEALNVQVQENRKAYFATLRVVGQSALWGASFFPNEEVEITLDKAVDNVIDDMKKPLRSSGVAFNAESFQSVYEEQLTGENSLTIFEHLQNTYPGDVTDSTEHTEYLRGVLNDVVNKVISEADTAPVVIGVNEKGTEVLGQIQDGRIQIQSGRSNSIENTSQLSVQETMVHELIHHITQYALDNNYTLRSEIDKLRNQVKKYIKVEDLMPAEVLHEFVAFAKTNAVLREKLAAIPATPSRDVTSGSLWDRLQAFFQKMVDYVQGKIHNTADVTADVAIDNLVHKLVDTNHRYKDIVNAKLGVLDRVDTAARAALTNYISDPLHRYQKHLVENPPKRIVGRVVKATLDIPFVASVQAGKETFAKVAKQVLRTIDVTESNMFVKLAREVQGMTEDNGRWHSLLRMSKHYVDQERRHIAERMANQLQDSYEGDLTNPDLAAVTQGFLKTDIVSITDKYTVKQVLNFLNHGALLDKEIASIVKKLQVYGENGNYYTKQAHSLGHYMATGSTTEVRTKLNAFNIVNMVDVSQNPIGDLKVAEELVNTLATLVAIKNTDQEISSRAASIMKREYIRDPKTNGVSYTLQTHKDFKEESLNRNFQGQKALMIKGYTTEILDPNIEIHVAPDNSKTEAEMKKLGYKKETVLINDKRYNVKQSRQALYVSKYGAKRTYMKTTASLTNELAKGTSIMDVVAGPNKKLNKVQEVLVLEDIKKREEKAVNDQFKDNIPTPKKEDDNILVPLMDGKGQIAGYRYAMTEVTKQNLLNKSYRFDVVMGQMAAGVHDKGRYLDSNGEPLLPGDKRLSSNDVNYLVLKEAYNDYTNGNAAADQYVTISPDSSDPRLREIYHMMPKNMKQDMIDIWGSNEIHVREELLDIIFGYRKISATDMPLFKFKGKTGKTLKVFDEIDKVLPIASTAVRITEQLLQDVVSIAKNNIVVKTGVVLRDNVISNNIILTMRGVRPIDIAKDSALAFNALTDYQDIMNKMHGLQHRLNVDEKLSVIARKNITRKIESYADAIDANPVKGLIEEGIFQSIVEDIDVHSDDYSFRGKATKYFTRKSDEFTEGKGKTKTVLAAGTTVYKEAYMTNDTGVYKVLLSLTQKSDFIARFVLHQHLLRKIDRVNASNKPHTPAQEIAAKKAALGDVIETFINYDVPTSPAMQYLNDMGILMFTKFLFRIQKIILRMFKNNPGSSVALLALEGAIGNQASIDDSFLLWSSLYGRVNIGITEDIAAATTISGIELLPFNL